MILDATAVVAFFRSEAGHDAVADVMAAGAAACTANIAETATVLVRDGMPFDEVASLIARLPITIHDVDMPLALDAARFYPQTKRFGLSLADRLCLALAKRENRPVWTADRVWLEAGPLIGVDVRLIR